MQIFFPKEEANEIRATILPEVAKKFIDLGIEVSIETGLGDNVFVSDTLYEEVGASICTNKSDGFKSADIVCKINKPSTEEIQELKKGTIYISFLDPFNEKQIVSELASAEVSSISTVSYTHLTLPTKA